MRELIYMKKLHLFFLIFYFYTTLFFAIGLATYEFFPYDYNNRDIYERLYGLVSLGIPEEVWSYFLLPIAFILSLFAYPRSHKVIFLKLIPFAVLLVPLFAPGDRDLYVFVMIGSMIAAAIYLLILWGILIYMRKKDSRSKDN
jgi:hypothetical protein